MKWLENMRNYEMNNFICTFLFRIGSSRYFVKFIIFIIVGLFAVTSMHNRKHS